VEDAARRVASLLDAAPIDVDEAERAAGALEMAIARLREQAAPP
jgi:hypothetical protein